MHSIAASTCISHLSLSFCAISRSQIEILTNFQCKIPIFKNFAPSQNSTRRQSLQYRTTVMQQESAISRIPGDACIFSLLHHSRHYAGILECQRMGYRIKMWDTNVSSISSLEYLEIPTSIMCGAETAMLLYWYSSAMPPILQ